MKLQTTVDKAKNKKIVTCIQDDVTQFLPADFKSSTRATTSFESESLLRELLTSLKVRKYNQNFFHTKFFKKSLLKRY
jgi:hypothetical protein